MSGTILSLEEITDDTVGGKAYGLARLVAMGMSVPPAFVIRDAQSGRYPADLDHRYRELGHAAVAVRSSATGEDGIDASFAGQYDSVLNVSGGEDLRKAVDHCVASAATGRAQAYRGDQQDEASAAESTTRDPSSKSGRPKLVWYSIWAFAADSERLVTSSITEKPGSLNRVI